METIEKIDTKKLKENIKVASEYQRFLKNQRKTMYLKGKREISPDEAAWKHQANREKLRLMYAAYGLMRGKTFGEIELQRYYKVDTDNGERHPLKKFQDKIDKIIDEYSKD